MGNHISKNNALHELEYQLQMGIDELKDKDVVKFFKNKSNGNFGDNEGDASAIQDGIDSYEENNK